MELRRFFIFTLIILNVAVFFQFLDFDEQPAISTNLNDRIRLIKQDFLFEDKKLKNILSAGKSSLISSLNYYKTNLLFGSNVLFQGTTKQYLSFMNQHEIAYSKSFYNYLYNTPTRQFTFLHDGLLVIEHRDYQIVHKSRTNEIEIRDYFLNHESKEVVKLIPLEESQWYYVESKQITRD